MIHNSGVYEIVNTVNGHIYGGSTVNYKKHTIGHKWTLRNNHHYNKYLQNAWNKYGEGAFEFHLTIPLRPDLQLVQLVEQECLNDRLGKRWSYNLNPWARGGSLKGRPGWNKGNKASAATRAKISKNRMGIGHSAESKAKISSGLKKAYATGKRKPWNLGKKHSEGTKAKMSKTHTGMKRSPEACANISKALKDSPNNRGSHIRWHVNREIFNPSCKFCMKENHHA